VKTAWFKNTAVRPGDILTALASYPPYGIENGDEFLVDEDLRVSINKNKPYNYRVALSGLNPNFFDLPEKQDDLWE